MSDLAHTFPAGLERAQKSALVVGAAAAAASLLGALGGADQFFRSYLFGFLFVLALSVGSLCLQMVQYLTGGRWGLATRRILEAGSRSFAVVAAMFVPLLLGLPRLYEWARPEAVALDPALQYKAAYLNVPFFVARAVVYFLIWLGLAGMLARWAAELESTTEYLRVSRRLRGVSGPGLVLMGLTITFSAVDWGMSLNPHWFSTIYGILFMVGPALTAMSLVIVVVALIGSEPPLDLAVDAETVHDLGKLMLAFVMLWAYINLSQFLIVWAGNLPEEIPFYLRRMQGGWAVVGLMVVVFHFLLPFLLLLSRDLKRNPRALASVALAVLGMRLLDLYWLVSPDLGGPGGGLHFHWLDVAAPVALSGLWLWYFLGRLRSRSLLPLGEPEVGEWLEAAEARA